MILTVQTVHQLLALPKQTVHPMNWSLERHRNTLKYRSTLLCIEEQEIIESLELIATFPLVPPMLQPHYSFSLFYNNQRIYAIDKVANYANHFNSSGVGRPLYQQKIQGTHEHTWSIDGDGYAEPIQLGVDASHKDYWSNFAFKTNISLSTDYRHPLDEAGGQIPLL